MLPRRQFSIGLITWAALAPLRAYAGLTVHRAISGIRDDQRGRQSIATSACLTVMHAPTVWAPVDLAIPLGPLTRFLALCLRQRCWKILSQPSPSTRTSLWRV